MPARAPHDDGKYIQSMARGASMPASRAPHGEERHGRSMARGASTPAWQGQDVPEDIYQLVRLLLHTLQCACW